MVPFAGYSMPIQFPLGILQEHRHTRDKVGLFDVSHMGQIVLKGTAAARYLEKLVCSDIQCLHEGCIRYTALTNQNGGIIDDLMVSRLENSLVLIVNAARKEVDYHHIQKNIGDNVDLTYLKNRALIALQGPLTSKVLKRFSNKAATMDFMTISKLKLDGVNCIITRSGYTGEDGYEISIPGDLAEDITKLFLEQEEVQPCGLGARDSLRLEAGFCLYGTDIDENTTPIEANLSWIIGKTRQDDKLFPGAPTIIKQIVYGPTKRRVGILPVGRAPARAGTIVTDLKNNAIGKVTSGGFSPSLSAPIAMGYIKTKFTNPGSHVGLMIRGREVKAIVTPLPFIAHNYFNSKKGI